jgi:hypothetical protein
MHEISLGALAAAVLAMGLVMLLELRSIARLRRAVDGNLQRVFEQLDLLRFESQQLIEGQALAAHAGHSPQAAAAGGRAAGAETAGGGAAAPAVAGGSTLAEARPALGAGEARLLASLAAARARRDRGASAHATVSAAAIPGRAPERLNRP